jgi:4-amino-4-deoxy-L-arabinose transferase-like glycosyltransferase
MLGCGFALFGAVAWLLPHRIWDPDEFEHLEFGWLIWQGVVPYRQVFENHPPLFHLAMQPLFWLFGHDDTTLALAVPIGARALSAAFSAGAIVATWLLARCSGRSLAAWFAAALLASNGIFLAKGIEVRPDTLATAALPFSAWLLLSGLKRPTGGRVRLACGGGVAALALLATQKTLFAMPGLGLACILVAWRRRTERRIASDAAVAVVGALLPLTLVAAWLAMQGALEDFVRWNLLLSGHWKRHYDDFIVYLVEAVPLDVPFVLASLTGAAMLAWRTWRAREDAVAPFVLLPLVALALGAVAIPNAQRQYYALLLPFAACGGGVALAAVAGIGGRARLPMMLTAVLAATAAAHLATAWRKPDRFALRKLAYVVTHTPPDATVLMSWTPGLAFRRPAFFYPYINDDTLSIIPPEAFAALGRDLRAGTVRPALVEFDHDMLALPDDVIDYVVANYRPTGYPHLWRRQ